jgi:hypothetical protein
VSREQELQELRWYEKSLQQLLPLVSSPRQKRLRTLLAQAQERIREFEKAAADQSGKRAA